MQEEQKSKKRKLRLPSLSFLVCLILSALAWFVLNFSKDQVQTLEYKVVCSFLPEGKKSCTLSDTTLLLTFNTRGLNYLSPRYSKANRIIDLPVSELIKNKSQRSAYTFSNKELRDFLQEMGYDELQYVQKPEVITLYIR
ncbi:MAG: hypothetical protein MJZ72_03645 [Bacteroidales bacterium]|nr:hypothetical protein [Bacteroidales bacterium]